jgi:hypothetical protein
VDLAQRRWFRFLKDGRWFEFTVLQDEGGYYSAPRFYSDFFFIRSRTQKSNNRRCFIWDPAILAPIHSTSSVFGAAQDA